MKSSPSLFFLARRFLQGPRAWLSLQGVLAVGGVALGVLILVLVIAVMRGFEQEMRTQILRFEPHLVALRRGLLPDGVAKARELERVEGVLGAMPFVQGQVFVEHDGTRLAPTMQALPAGVSQGRAEVLAEMVVAGRWDLRGRRVVLGQALAAELGVEVGDKISLYNPQQVEELVEKIAEVQEGEADAEALRGVLAKRELEVAGIFASGRYTYDRDFFFTSLAQGQALYGLSGEVHGIALQVGDATRVEDWRAPVGGVVAQWPEGDVELWSWRDRNRSLLASLESMRGMLYFLFLFILLVAAFVTMSTLIAAVVQKRQAIGVLKAVGARGAQVVGIFLAQGLVVGVLGALAGVGLGLGMLPWRNALRPALEKLLGQRVFAESVYEFAQIPAALEGGDLAMIGGGAVLMATLATLPIALWVWRWDAAKILRGE